MNEKIARLYSRFKEKEAAAEFLGIQLIELGDGYAKMEIPLSDSFLQSEGIIFGGIATALADYIAAYGAMTRGDIQAEMAPTKTLSIKFLSPTTLRDKTLVGEGRILSDEPYENKKGQKRRNIVVEIIITSKQTKKEKARCQVESVILARDNIKIETTEISELKKLLEKAEQNGLTETEKAQAIKLIDEPIPGLNMCYICEHDGLDKNRSYTKSVYDTGLCTGHARNIIYLTKEKE